MFKVLFVCEGVPFLGVKSLYIVSEDFQGHSFHSKELFQVVNDSICSGRAHLIYEGVLGEIIYDE